MCGVCSRRLSGIRDRHVCIAVFGVDGLGLTGHRHWGMGIASTQLVLDCSETLEGGRLRGQRLHEKLLQILCFGVI